jgi:hypothetical protein
VSLVLASPPRREGEQHRSWWMSGSWHRSNRCAGISGQRAESVSSSPPRTTPRPVALCLLICVGSACTTPVSRPAGHNNRSPPDRRSSAWAHGPPGRQCRPHPNSSGWRVHDHGSGSAKAAAHYKTRTGHGEYSYLHAAIDGYSRLAYTENFPDEKARTAIGLSAPRLLRPPRHHHNRTHRHQ